MAIWGKRNNTCTATTDPTRTDQHIEVEDKCDNKQEEHKPRAKIKWKPLVFTTNTENNEQQNGQSMEGTTEMEADPQGQAPPSEPREPCEPGEQNPSTKNTHGIYNREDSNRGTKGKPSFGISTKP